MPDAEWIITLDDGPLPSDVVQYDGNGGDDLLAPLTTILKTLREHPAGPMPAVFFLRGPGYPWGKDSEPPKPLFTRGVKMILDAGHAVGIHAYKHDPELWWNWLLKGAQIREDLDRFMDYFSTVVPSPITIFRPPYGQGGPPGEEWATQHHIRHQLWDMDTEDWLHHPDASPLVRRFVDDPEQHLKHILDSLPVKMFINTCWPGANDFLMHVSARTAGYLRQILDCICRITLAQGHEPRFVVPKEYLCL